jgi:hypothetical protein
LAAFKNKDRFRDAMEFLILKFLYPPTERHAAALNGNKALGEQVGARAPRLLFPERHTRKPRTSRATKMVHECNYRKEKGNLCLPRPRFNSRFGLRKSPKRRVIGP